MRACPAPQRRSAGFAKRASAARTLRRTASRAVRRFTAGVNSALSRRAVRVPFARPALITVGRTREWHRAPVAIGTTHAQSRVRIAIGRTRAPSAVTRAPNAATRALNAATRAPNAATRAPNPRVARARLESNGQDSGRPSALAAAKRNRRDRRGLLERRQLTRAMREGLRAVAEHDADFRAFQHFVDVTLAEFRVQDELALAEGLVHGVTGEGVHGLAERFRGPAVGALFFSAS